MFTQNEIVIYCFICMCITNTPWLQHMHSRSPHNGPHSPSGTSCVFIRCMVLEIQLFLIHAFHKVVAQCFRELGYSSRTTQCIKMRLVPLCWCEPALSNDTSIVSLTCRLGYFLSYSCFSCFNAGLVHENTVATTF